MEPHRARPHRRVRPLLALLLLSAGLARSAGASEAGVAQAAREFSRWAREAGLERVAVLPFSSPDGASFDEGWRFSEEFGERLQAQGVARVPARSMVLDILVAQRLSQGGEDSRALRELGELLQADAAVSGVLLARSHGPRFYAVLLDLKTGGVLASVGTPPERVVEPLPPWETADVRDAVADDPCSVSSLGPDRREARLLDCRARSWASQGHACGEPADVARIVGLPGLGAWQKGKFHERVCYWHARKRLQASAR